MEPTSIADTPQRSPMSARPFAPAAEAGPSDAEAGPVQQHRQLEALLAALVDDAPGGARYANPHRGGAELAVHLAAEDHLLESLE